MSSTEPVHAAMRILNQIAFSTNGFTDPLEQMPDSLLMFMPAVDSELLDFIPTLIRILHPREKANFKNCIVYLTELQEYQRLAWQRFQDQHDAEQLELSRAINELQQKINGRYHTTNI
jgi:hypothetical protein